MKNSYILILILILITSCKPKDVVLNSGKMDVEKKTILKNLESNDFLISSMRSSLELKVIDNDKTIELGGNFRFIKDSAIWLSVSPGLGIEVARVLIRKDSVFILDRLKSVAYTGNLEALSKLIKFKLNFNDFQSIFLASFANTQNYIYNSKKLTSASLVQNQESFLFQGNIPFADNVLMKELSILKNENKVSGFKLAINDSNKLQVAYSAFQSIDSFKVPNQIFIELLGSSRKSSLFLNYKKPEMDSDLSVSVKISSKYSIVPIETLFNNSKTK